jgi:predicted transcriptional regulator
MHVMSDKSPAIESNSVEQIADIVCAYVSNNHVAASDLPALIRSVHAAVINLTRDGQIRDVVEPAQQKMTAAQIRKSVTPDALISFIDGRGYKTLKRHLTKHGLDPASYRMRFGLPADYPMVAAAYSETRSGLAKSIGLGQRGELGGVFEERRLRQVGGARRLN